MDQLPCISLDTTGLSAADGLNAWRAAIPQYEIHADDGFTVRAKAWLLGDLIVSRTTVSSVTLIRTAERIRQDGADTYNLNVLLRGSWTGDIDGREMTVGPGQVVGFDLARPFRVDNAPGESVSLVIGRGALQDALRGEPDMHGRVFDGAAGLLLSDHCLAMARHLPHATTADATPIVRATLAQLVAGLSAPRSASGLAEVSHSRLRHDVRRFIDRHIGTSDLGPDMICRSLGLSRTTLYAAFRSVGGVATLIQRRRLQAVRALLMHPDETRTIGDVSRSLGFAGPSHFSAAFKKEFGCSPSEVRAAQGVPISSRHVSGDVSDQFRSWLLKVGSR